MKEFKSNAFHFRDFLESVVWKDLQTELEAAKQRLFELLSTEENTVEIYRLQGRIDALDVFSNMPSEILVDLELYEGEEGSGKEEEHLTNHDLKED